MGTKGVVKFRVQKINNYVCLIAHFLTPILAQQYAQLAVNYSKNEALNPNKYYSFARYKIFAKFFLIFQKEIFNLFYFEYNSYISYMIELLCFLVL